MDYQSHRLLSEIVGKKMGVPELDAFVEGAVFPDYADDLLLQLPGQRPANQVFGNHIVSFQHFCHPIGRRKYNGYCMKRDPSWPKELRPPAGKLQVVPGVWITKLSLTQLRSAHPMLSILEKSSGKRVTQITFCTAPVYGGWIAEQITSKYKLGTPGFWRGVGAIAHLAADMCVWHHTWLCLLNGHQAYEGAIGEALLKMNIGRWDVPTESPVPSNIRTYIEGIAEMTAVWKTPPPEDWAVNYGHAVTCGVLRWAFAQIKG